MAGDGTFYPAGTVLKDVSIPIKVDGSTLAEIGALSSDLEEGSPTNITPPWTGRLTAFQDADGAISPGRAGVCRPTSMARTCPAW